MKSGKDPEHGIWKTPKTTTRAIATCSMRVILVVLVVLVVILVTLVVMGTNINQPA